VILAQHKLTTHFVAVKCLRKEAFAAPAQLERLKNELNILNSLEHPNIVRLLDSFETYSHMCFVMELCGGGDLASYIRRRKQLTEPVAAYLFRQVC
jgi:serine/threonine protein kinase